MGRPRGGVNGEDLFESAASFVAQGAGDAPVEALLDLRTTTLRFLGQGRESGQLETVPNGFFDRDVDEVGRILLRASNFTRRGGGFFRGGAGILACRARAGQARMSAPPPRCGNGP